tara:strand:+ start:58 stop:177 length:120 start_codon:yes stop_codon:yes gene_type:complete
LERFFAQPPLAHRHFPVSVIERDELLIAVRQQIEPHGMA